MLRNVACSPSEEPLDLVIGKAGAERFGVARQVQLFGAVATAGGQFLDVSEFQGGSQWSLIDPDRRERLWLIESAVQEAERQGENLTPASFNDLQQRSLPGASYSNRGVVQLAVELHRYCGRGLVRMDGGQSLEVYAIGLNITAIVPAAFREVTQVSPAITATGIVIDNLTYCAITPIEVTRGTNSFVLLTQRINVPQATEVTVEIPEFARECQIRQGPAGAAATAWTIEYSGTGGASPAFTIPIGASRQSDRVLLNDGTHLVSDVDQNNFRQFVVTYVIRP